MGLSLSRIYSSLSSLAFWGKDKEVRILMVGLDSAGKVRTPCGRRERMIGYEMRADARAVCLLG